MNALPFVICMLIILSMVGSSLFDGMKNFSHARDALATSIQNERNLLDDKEKAYFEKSTKYKRRKNGKKGSVPGEKKVKDPRARFEGLESSKLHLGELNNDYMRSGLKSLLEGVYGKCDDIVSALSPGKKQLAELMPEDQELKERFYKMLRGDLKHPALKEIVTLSGKRKPICFFAASEKLLTAFLGADLTNRIRKKEQSGYHFRKDEVEQLMIEAGLSSAILDLFQYRTPKESETWIKSGSLEAQL